MFDSGTLWRGVFAPMVPARTTPDNRTMESTHTSRARLQRRALWLEYATIAWNVGEAFFTIGLGIAAGSLALVGFGTDSVVEVLASLVVVWHIHPGHEVDRPDRTRLALRLVALAFATLAVVLGTFAIRDIVTRREAGESLLGIAYMTMTAAVMFGLAITKQRLAAQLQSAPLRSEAALTFLDGILSSLTLLGLALNAFAGLAWADPMAALIVSVAAATEARENWVEASEG
jgi:divalent metal cation (Fe/Co/Zn/Cd) transporter